MQWRIRWDASHPGMGEINIFKFLLVLCYCCTQSNIRDLIYFTGDEGLVDKNGLFWIKGRTDDVINVSGHRNIDCAFLRVNEMNHSIDSELVLILTVVAD